MSQKRVYTFGNGQAEGNAQMREALGGKGANLAEMNLIGVPVPPGFTITTDTCNEYYKVGQEKIVELLQDDVESAVKHIEKLMNSKFGDATNPLLVSVRSGARASMPGMMDTILNLGLNDEVAEGMVAKTQNPHFVYDSYRRFVQMYGDYLVAILVPFLCIVGMEYNLTACGTWACGKSLCDDFRLLELVLVENGVEEFIEFLRLAAKDGCFLVNETFLEEIHCNLHHCSTGTLTVTCLEEPKFTFLYGEFHILHIVVVLFQLVL